MNGDSVRDVALRTSLAEALDRGDPLVEDLDAVPRLVATIVRESEILQRLEVFDACAQQDARWLVTLREIRDAAEVAIVAIASDEFRNEWEIRAALAEIEAAEAAA